MTITVTIFLATLETFSQTLLLVFRRLLDINNTFCHD
jgi:uncharacterized membrane protein YhaH (DUF805 family)